VTNPPASPFFAPPRWEGTLAAIFGLIVFFAFVLIGEAGRGTLAASFVTAILVCVRICWPLRRQPWFLITMASIVAVHVLVMMVFPRTTAASWSGLTFIPFTFADVGLILVIVYGLFRCKYGAPVSLLANDD
jgi:hypothetical protein